MNRHIVSALLTGVVAAAAPAAHATNFNFLTHPSLAGVVTFDAFLGNSDDIIAPGFNNFGAASQFADTLGNYGFLGGSMSTQGLTILGPQFRQVFGTNEHTALSMFGEWNNNVLASFNNFFMQELDDGSASVITINPDQTYTSSFVLRDDAFDGRIQFTGSGRYLLSDQDPSTLYSGDLLGHFNTVTPLLPEFWRGVAHETQTYVVLDGPFAGATGVNTLTFYSFDRPPVEAPQPLGAPWQVTGIAAVDPGGTSITIGSNSLQPPQDGTAVLSGGDEAQVDFINFAGGGNGELRVEGAGTTVSRGPGDFQQISFSTRAGAQAELSVTGGGRLESGLVIAFGDGDAKLVIDGPGSVLDLACADDGPCTTSANGLGGVLADQGIAGGSGSMETTIRNGGRAAFSAVGNGSTGIGAYSKHTIVIDGADTEVTIAGSQTATNGLVQTGVAVEQDSSLSVSNGGKLLLTRATAGFNGVGAGSLFPDDPNAVPASIVVDGAGSLIDAGVLFVIGEHFVQDFNQGQWVVAGAGAESVAVVSNGGTVKADTIRIGAAGTLSGNGGTLEGNVENNGTLAPGASPGTLNIVGNYEQSADGVLVIEIGGRTPGSFDVLNISGTATFQGGTLRIELVEGFVPEESDTFEFLTAALFEGDFGRYELPTFGAGRTFAVALGPQGFTASVTAVPLPAAGWLLLGGVSLLLRSRPRA